MFVCNTHVGTENIGSELVHFVFGLGKHGKHSGQAPTLLPVSRKRDGKPLLFFATIASCFAATLAAADISTRSLYFDAKFMFRGCLCVVAVYVSWLFVWNTVKMFRYREVKPLSGCAGSEFVSQCHFLTTHIWFG